VPSVDLHVCGGVTARGRQHNTLLPCMRFDSPVHPSCADPLGKHRKREDAEIGGDVVRAWLGSRVRLSTNNLWGGWLGRGVGNTLTNATFAGDFRIHHWFARDPATDGFIHLWLGHEHTSD
jgi:hypothetical protein